MADEDQKLGTALAVVEEQQKVVGSALVAASGTAVLAENSDSSMQILEQIRDIQVKTLRGIGEVVSTMKNIFALDKLQDRRAKEDATELEKEKDKPQLEESGDLPKTMNNEEGGGKGVSAGILGAIGGMAFFKKLFAPFIAIFGKAGLLVRLFGRFGPLGALILGFTLFYKYSDEIAKALAPAVEKIKEIIPKLKPVIDFLKRVGDFLIKQLLEGIGGALTLVVTAVEGVIDGFKMIFEGDVLGGLNRMFGMDGLLGFLIELPKKIFDKTVEFLGGLAEAMGIDFKALYDNIALYVTDTITNIKNFFIDLATNILTFFTDAYNTVKTTIIDAVQGMFAPIVDFFTSIGDKIKSAINGIIDALPLPDFIKNKIKLETKASKEAGNRIDETGVKSKYVDDTITGMQRERMTGGSATMGEASAEFTGEKYGTAKITKSGTSGYDSVSAIMTPEEFTEYNKLDTNGQMDYLKALDDKEQDRREMIKKLHEDKLEFDKANQDYINKYKTAPDEMMSPDDQMLRDDKFQREAKIQANTISDLDNNNQGAITVVNNNYNTNNSSVANQTDVHSGALDTGIDSYHDKLATASA